MPWPERCAGSSLRPMTAPVRLLERTERRCVWPRPLLGFWLLHPCPSPPTAVDWFRLSEMLIITGQDGATRARMIKSELIERIAAQNPHLYQRDVEKIVNAILDTITMALARGDRVELRDFGVFAVKKQDARTARNPRNGEAVLVGQKAKPTFKT